MALLDGGLASIFGAAFGGVYLPAVLTKYTRADANDGTITETSTEYACRAQVDAATEAMRRQAGYTGTDVRILILSASLAVTVTSDDRITVAGSTYRIANVARDPAGAYFECRGQV